MSSTDAIEGRLIIISFSFISFESLFAGDLADAPETPGPMFELLRFNGDF